MTLFQGGGVIRLCEMTQSENPPLSVKESTGSGRFFCNDPRDIFMGFVRRGEELLHPILGDTKAWTGGAHLNKVPQSHTAAVCRSCTGDSCCVVGVDRDGNIIHLHSLLLSGKV